MNRIVHIFVFLSIIQLANAQNSSVNAFNYSIGGLGIHNTEPVSVNTNSSCLTLNNGLYIFLTSLINGQGNFWTYCIDAEKQFSLFAFPNPTNDKIFLRPKTILEKTEDFQIQLSNNSGQLLRKHILKGEQFQQGYYLDLSQYPIGAYFIYIVSLKNKYQLKVIKGAH